MASERQILAASVFKDYESVLECDGVPTSMLQSHFTNGAWWTFASSMILMSVCGSLWTFGEYSEVFKAADGYSLSQASVQTLGLLSSVGNYVVLDSGFIILKYGTVFGLVYGCSLVCAGYFALWLCISVAQAPLPFYVIASCFIVFGHGCGTIDNALLTEATSCFPNHTGYIVGCLKGLYGLSAAILTIIATLLFDAKPRGFILFLSIFSGIVGIVFIPIVHVSKGVVEESSSRIHWKLTGVSVGLVAAALGIFWLAITEMQALAQASTWALCLIMVIVAVLSLFLVVIPGKSNRENDSLREAPSLMTINKSYKDMVMSPDFYMLFIILLVGIGTGIMFINNAGQILPAFTGREGSPLVPSFVAMLSCLNSLGRLTSGFSSELLKSKISRPWFLVFYLGLQTIAFILLVLGGPAALWPAGGLVAFSWGGIWAMVPLLHRELWGSKDFSMKYSTGVLAGIGGSLLFSTLLAGSLFDREAKVRNESPYCYAPACFRPCFGYAALCNFLAMILAMALCRTTESVYRPSTSMLKDS